MSVILLLSLVVVAFEVPALAWSPDAGLSCLDDNGQPIDWFIAIKLPKNVGSSDDQYYFMTSKNPAWQLAECDVMKTCGPIYNTINQAYNLRSKTTSMSFFYNDEYPNHSNSATYGHMKGAVAFDTETTGFWLIDSVPKYPTNHSKSYYPKTGLRYGQHFFCATFDISQLAIIAEQLSIARPQVYPNYTLPGWLARKIPDLWTLVNKKPPRSPRPYLQARLQSIGGTTFIHFSKSRNFRKDLYAGIVAPTLKASLLVECWVDGAKRLPSCCNVPYKVYNIKQMQLQGYKWTTTKDHSKWAIAMDEKYPWVCLGDMNRMASQVKRGGGALCLMHPEVWTAFNKMVVHIEECGVNGDQSPCNPY